MTTDRNHRGLGTLLATVRAGGDDQTDGHLLGQFLARRDEAAFAELVRRHGPMVLDVCRRALGNATDADDAFQATFLVLVRKAASLTARPVVGDWLHGVARRTALKAKATAARRRSKEQALARPEAQADGGRNDWLPLLDDGLRRLPEKYRLPVVLCDLQGATRQQAARQLGWPEGTVAGRLARGRALLAKRLLRGAKAAPGTLPGAVAVGAAQAAVPPGLAQTTAQAAALVAGGEVTARGALSAGALALAQGVLKAMFWNKFKVGALALVVAVAAVGGGGLALRGVAGEGDAPQAAGLAAVPKKERRPKDLRAAKAPAPPRKDKDLLQGRWKVTEADVLGKRTREADLGQIWVISDGRIVVQFGDGDKDDEWTFKLDPSATPRAIDLTMTVGVKAGSTVEGIYERKGDTLRVCFNGNGKRPSDFGAAHLGGSRFGAFYALERVKARPEAPKKEAAEPDMARVRKAFREINSTDRYALVGRPVLAERWTAAAIAAGIQELKHVKDVRVLNLSNTKVTDEALAGLKDIKDLQTLDLSRTGVTDAGLARLVGLTGLRKLRLDGNKVTDAGLKSLGRLTGLEELGLGFTAVTDAGVAELKGLRSIQRLDLDRTKVTGAGLAAFASLQELNLFGTPAADAGLKELKGLVKLRALGLRGTKVTDAGLAHLRGLRELRKLSLREVGVTDAGLAELKALTALEELDVAHSRVTDVGLKVLQGLEALRILDLGYTPVTDAGLEELKSLKNLVVLRLAGTKVTDKGVEGLQKALPQLLQVAR